MCGGKRKWGRLRMRRVHDIKVITEMYLNYLRMACVFVCARVHVCMCVFLCI